MRTERLLYLLLPVGLFVGYFLPHPQPGLAPAAELQSTGKRLTRPRPSIANSTDNQRISSLATRVGTRESRGDPESVAKTIEIKDIPALLDQLLSQAGPNGLSYQIRNEISEMLAKWAEQDFSGAYTWAISHPNKNASKHFLAEILKTHAETDFDETLTLIRSLKDDHGILIDLGQQLIKTAAKRGAKDAFEVLAAFPSDSGGSSGSSTEFPAGFDFKTFCELVSTHQKTKKDGSTPFSFFPTNVLEEWAKVDSSAALQFFLSADELPFNDLGDITKSFLNILDPDTAYPWIVSQYNTLNPELSKKFASNLHSVFPSELGAQPFLKLLDYIPSSETRERMATEMLKGFGSGATNGELIYADLLLALPTPEKRLHIIQNSSMRFNLSRLSDDRIASYGITREQLKPVPSH